VQAPRHRDCLSPNSTCPSRHDSIRNLAHAFWHRGKIARSGSTARHARHDKRDTNDAQHATTHAA